MCPDWRQKIKWYFPSIARSMELAHGRFDRDICLHVDTWRVVRSRPGNSPQWHGSCGPYSSFPRHSVSDDLCSGPHLLEAGARLAYSSAVLQSVGLWPGELTMQYTAYCPPSRIWPSVSPTDRFMYFRSGGMWCWVGLDSRMLEVCLQDFQLSYKVMNFGLINLSD